MIVSLKTAFATGFGNVVGAQMAAEAEAEIRADERARVEGEIVEKLRVVARGLFKESNEMLRINTDYARVLDAKAAGIGMAVQIIETGEYRKTEDKS